MKHLTHIILLSVVLSLFGCSDRRATSVLNHADSLLSTHPDTVLVMLDSLRAERSSDMSRRQKMRLELLRADAQNKAFVNFTTDSVMREVTAYYDAHGTAQERMRAHYLLGCTYRDMGDAPRALECYHDAIDKADTTSADCDYKLLSRVYGQMAGLYRRQNMLTQSIEHLDKMQVYSLLSGNTISFIITQDQIGSIYGLMNNYDSLLAIKNRVVQLYKSRGLYTHAAISLGTTIYAYLANKDYLQAKRMMDIYETKSGHFHTNGDIAKGKEIYYYTKGTYYLDIQKYDSAEFFFRKLLNNANTFNDRISASQGLCKLYTELNNNDSVAKFAQNSYIFNDSAYLVNSAEEINRVNALYDYNVNKHKALVKEREAERYRNMIIIGGILSLVIISAIIYVVIRNKRRAQDEFTALNTRYFETLGKYNQSVKDLDLLHRDVSKYKLEKGKEIDRLHQVLSSYGNKDIVSRTWNADRFLQSCDISMRLHSLASKGKCASSVDFASLTELVSQHLPSFYQHISSPSYGLSEREVVICVLVRLQFLPSEISVLFDCSKQIVSNIRTSINRKLFNQEGTKSLNSNIKSL